MNVQFRFSNFDLRFKRRPARRGFSFVEIMFAVMILGIGFIMVSAIFPVALQQAKISTEEITAAPNARNSVNIVTQLISDNNAAAVSPITVWDTTNIRPTGTAALPSPAKVLPLPMLAPARPLPGPNAALWDVMRGNLILPQDPRNAWIALYRRDGDPTTNTPTALATWAPYIYLYTFPVQSRSTPTFALADMTLPNRVTTAAFDDATNFPANLMARRVQVAVVDSDSTTFLVGQPDLIAFDISTPHPSAAAGIFSSDNVQAAVEGAYVIISDDKITTAANKGRMNGRMFRLGARRFDLDQAVSPASNDPFKGMTPRIVYELQPGSDLKSDSGPDGITGTVDDINTIGMSGFSPSTVAVSGTADAYLIGKGYSADTLNQIRLDAAPPIAITYEDHGMPIGAYVTFIKVK